MALGSYRRGIGVFSNRRDVELAINELKDIGFSMNQISVVAKDVDDKDSIRGTDVNKPQGNEAKEGAEIGSVTGTALGMAGGLLAGLGTLAIPGIGPVVAAGTIGTTLATTLAGGGIGAVSGGLVGALAGLGIPSDRAQVYSDRLASGDYLIIVEGRSDEIARAEMVLLNNRGIEEWGVYDANRDEAVRH
ncbi:general stress protein [Oscillatoria salina]|uniref:general stress protein n=1 Tax=Oscillatoria salina TaxID=331517 RepID=UPI001CCEB0AD|nr:general stress protein [Oscillatoria salina]